MFFLSGPTRAQSAEGSWLAQNYMPDDGGYTGLFRSWFILGPTHIDRVISLGAHYYKVKYEIQKKEGRSLQLLNLETEQLETLNTQFVGEGLEICLGERDCSIYDRVSDLPDFYLPQGHIPSVSLQAEWCVDTDCAVADYSDLQVERLFNLGSDFGAISERYSAPEELEQRQGVRMFVDSFSYRLENQPERLESFSTVFNFTGKFRGVKDTALAQTPVRRLQEGTFVELQVPYAGKALSVRFIMKKK